jgi:chromosome partitioning protein
VVGLPARVQASGIEGAGAMKTVAIYNMKGGVGKTTTAVNLSYLAAAGGQRTLLWDLDPQAASSFAFRVRPHVAGFGRRILEDGQALGAAIKETDYDNLLLLPADFAYRKFDRLLDSFGRPERLMRSLLETIGREFDVVFLDCPAGFSLLIESVFCAADAILVPTIPTVLSLRTVARLFKRADRSELQTRLTAFFNMVDRRRSLHRRFGQWSNAHSDVFLSAQIPYASVVEQMAVRRMPLPVFAPRDGATAAFADIWTELQKRLLCEEQRCPDEPDERARRLQHIESLIGDIESADREAKESPGRSDVYFIHRFDTEHRDLERCGHVLELHEKNGTLLIVAARAGADAAGDVPGAAQARIDSSWALQILSGELSPLAALERRVGQPGPCTVANIRTMVGDRGLRRVDTRVATPLTSIQ